MTARRAFLRGIAAGAGVLAAFREGGLESIRAAGSAAAGRMPEEVAGRRLLAGDPAGLHRRPRLHQPQQRRGLALAPRRPGGDETLPGPLERGPVYTMWQLLEPQIESVRRGLARAFGCDPEEMAITRNASEALEIVQLGLELKRGDEILTTNQDYPRMLTTWRQRERREGVVLRTISFPVPPPSLADLLDRFAQAMTPRTRVIHICHITNLTGQIFPVKEICRMARARGIEVIVDGAHAFAHFPFTLADLDCDYYGTSLHKWLFAPHGTGFLYVRKSKIRASGRSWPRPRTWTTNIRKFEEIGTHPAANHNAIAEALVFQETIGIERKAARLRYLRDRWMKRLSGQKGVRIHTSFDPTMSCAIGNVGIEGVDTAKLAQSLWDRRRIIVVPILHEEYQGLRVTPNVYTTLDEVDVFAEEMERVIAKGLPA